VSSAARLALITRLSQGSQVSSNSAPLDLDSPALRTYWVVDWTTGSHSLTKRCRSSCQAWKKAALKRRRSSNRSDLKPTSTSITSSGPKAGATVERTFQPPDMEAPLVLA